MAGGEDLSVASKIVNHPLNLVPQHMHPTSLAKVLEVILAPVELIAAEALVDLSTMLDVISFLMLRG